MEAPANDLLEIILRDCAVTHPRPWYPADYVQQTGVSRDRVEADLDRLRLGGLLQLTEWVQGKGQGYALTPQGMQVLENPRLFQRLRQYGVEPQATPPPLRRVESRTTTWDRGEAIRNALLQPGRPVVTMLLILMNVLIFLAGAYVARQEDPDLLGPYLEGSDNVKVRLIQSRFGALNRAMVVSGGEWWRLLGYSFVHSGVFPHLLMNMLALWMLGRFTEAMFGSARYLALYLVSGLGGGCAVALNPATAAVGASGCVCGVLAASGMWVFINRPYLPGPFVAGFFRSFMINVFLLVLISMHPRVSSLGHLGGAIAGAVVAVPLTFSRFGHGWQRWLGYLAALAVPPICVAVVFFSITDRERIDHVQSILLRVQELANTTYKRQALPLVQKKSDELQKDAASKELREALAGVQRRLDSAAAQLDRVSFSDPRLKDALTPAKDYVASWLTYFAAFSKILDDQDALRPQDRDELERLHERTQTLTRQLNKSPLFSRRESD
jgi:rhomboid protease GluP